MRKSIYGKWQCWLMAAILVLGMGSVTACGGSSGDKAQEPQNQEQNEDKDKAEEPEGEESDNAESGKVTITEQVLLEQDGIKITAKELTEDSFLGPEVGILIENSGEKNVTVQVRNMSVNGIMMEPMFSCDVAAGKSANDGITFMNTELEKAGIEIIQNMEFSFHVFDSESWDTIFDTENIYLATSADGAGEQAVDDAGQLVLEQEGISITIKEVESEDSFWGTDIYVYIKNESEQNVTVQARSVSINGIMVEPVFSCEVAAGKKAYDTITFLESDLTENGIESIDELELSFSVFNTDSWDTIFDSDNIQVSFAE